MRTAIRCCWNRSLGLCLLALAAGGLAPGGASHTAAQEPLPWEGSLWERAEASGDWFGLRNGLAENGWTWDISSTNFNTGVTKGGVDERFTYRGRTDMLLHVDGDKAGLWQGLFIDLHGEGVYGNPVGPFVGTFSPVSLPQVLPNRQSVAALTGVKVTQALSENFVLFGGKINTLDDFNQPFTGGARGLDGFQNFSLLLNPILARTIPYSTFGAGFAALNDNQEVVLSGAVYDTNNTPTESGFDTFFNNGFATIGAVNLPTNFLDLPGHHMIFGVYSNGWYNALEPTAYFDPEEGLQIVAPFTQGSWSVGYAFDQALYVSPCDPARRWGVFGNVGIADNNPNPFHWAANIGVGGSSPLDWRPQDSFGVGYFYVGLSDYLKNLAPRLLPLDDEQGVEVFYNVGFTRWFHVTADLQVVDPARQRLDSVVVFGLRAKLDF